MTDRLIYGQFTIERILAATPARVFEAWTRPEVKARWLVGPEGWTEIDRVLDVRIGGTERAHGRFPNGIETIYEARYYDVVPDRRLLFTFDMVVAGRHYSLSLASVEIEPHGDGSRLVFTEHAAFLTGSDETESRRHGTAGLIEQLVAIL